MTRSEGVHSVHTRTHTRVHSVHTRTQKYTHVHTRAHIGSMVLFAHCRYMVKAHDMARQAAVHAYYYGANRQVTVSAICPQTATTLATLQMTCDAMHDAFTLDYGHVPCGTASTRAFMPLTLPILQQHQARLHLKQVEVSGRRVRLGDVLLSCPAHVELTNRIRKAMQFRLNRGCQDIAMLPGAVHSTLPVVTPSMASTVGCFLDATLSDKVPVTGAFVGQKSIFFVLNHVHQMRADATGAHDSTLRLDLQSGFQERDARLQRAFRKWLNSGQPVGPFLGFRPRFRESY